MRLQGTEEGLWEKQGWDTELYPELIEKYGEVVDGTPASRGVESLNRTGTELAKRFSKVKELRKAKRRVDAYRTTNSIGEDYSSEYR